MPTAFIQTSGIANGNSVVTTLRLPEHAGLAHEVQAIQLHRGAGVRVTSGNAMLVGITHRTDMTTGALLDDQDDLLAEADKSFWYVRGLTNIDSQFDLIPPGMLLAGDQQVVTFNGIGTTTSMRLMLYYRDVRVSLQQWTLLKRKTSFEAE